MKKIKLAIAICFALVGVLAMTPNYAHANAAEQIELGIRDAGGGEGGAGGNNTPLGVRIQQVINILLYVLGAIAVVMIVLGGIRYVTSNGEASGIKSAKDTILYAVIGLVVAIIAYAIVNFIVSSFGAR